MFMNITIRPTRLTDGQAITQLVKQSKSLDVNSTYLYFLLADHFSDTCAIALNDNDEPLGFVTAYRMPKNPEVLFVWQIAVTQSARGTGLAKRLLVHLTQQAWFSDIESIVCTISPQNLASNALFASFAKTFDARIRTSPYLTQDHLGLHHDDEPYVIIEIPT